jgi:hypothetical protein
VIESEGIRIDQVSYAAVGAERVSEAKLRAIRSSVVRLAMECGYPHERALKGQQEFDSGLCRLLFDRLEILPAEAGRAECWQYIACALMPDLVVWRFNRPSPDHSESKTDLDRFLGGVRNAFGRLWWRSFVLLDEQAEDKFWLADGRKSGLTEDNFVALLERPRIGAISRLCVQIAKTHVAKRCQIEGVGKSPEQTLMREVVKRAIRFNSFVEFSAMRLSEIEALVNEMFDETIAAMRGGSAD